MDNIINYFSDMPTTHRAVVLFGGLSVFFIIENTIPLFKSYYDKTKHTGINLLFTFTTILINFSMAGILVGTAVWVENHEFGVLYWMQASPIVALTFGLAIMDFLGSWLPHYIEHHVKWLWQIHVVHHTDQNVDTTTANRHHPCESIVRFLFTTFAILIVGAPMWLIFFYQTLSVVLTQFSHSNLKMPGWLDGFLRLFFCTPNMHRIHHHYRQPYSDTNYGNIFSFWDRIFGTFIIVDNSKLVYGVDTYMDDNEANDVITLLKMPFTGYRDSIEYSEEEKL